MTKLPATLKLRPKDPKFKASIHNLLRPCLKVTVIEQAENTAHAAHANTQGLRSDSHHNKHPLALLKVPNTNSLVLYVFQRGFQVFKV